MEVLREFEEMCSVFTKKRAMWDRDKFSIKVKEAFLRADLEDKLWNCVLERWRE